MTVEFYPNRTLNPAILRAYAASLRVAEVDARANRPSSKADVRLIGHTLEATGLGAVFEEGRGGGYPIQPKNALALRFPDGSFASFAKGGPMSPQPYIGPAGVRWAHGGFHNTARPILRAAGF